MAETGKYTTISIPVELAERCKEYLENTGFKNLSDFTAFVLREIIITRREWNTSTCKEDEERVKEKLRKLGYL